MPSYQFADLATVRVSSGGTTAPTAGASESWTVGAVTGTFPTLTTGQVLDVVDPAAPTELMTVTATASATAWTVTRGAYGTTPVAHLGGFFVRNVVTAAGLAALGNGTSALVPTAVKTANYTASVNDLIPVDTTSGPVTVTLPTAPADKAQVAVKHVIQGSSNAVTINRGGSDVFNKAGGSTSLTLSTVNQAMTLQYKASGGIWYVLSDSLSKAALDTSYASLAGGTKGRLKKSLAPVQRPRLHVIQTRVATLRPVMSATNLPTVAAKNSTTIQSGGTVALGATTLPLAASVPAGNYYVDTSSNEELVVITSVTGSSAPFTANLQSPTTINHNNGITVANYREIPMAADGSQPFNVWGSVAYATVSGLLTASDPHSTSYTPPWQYEFVTDAPLFAIRMNISTGAGNWFEVLVNDEIVYSATPLSGGRYVQFDWNTDRKHRRYTIRGDGSMAVRGVRLGYTDTIYAPRSDATIKAGFLGDSYCQQIGTTGNIDTLPHLIAGMLGWRESVSVEGGTGYNAPTTAGATANFKDRAADIIAAAPDVVILLGGHNDDRTTSTNIQGAAVTTIQAIQAGLPGVPIVVFGVLTQGSTWDTNYALTNTGLAAAASATGVPFVPTVGWMTGTGTVAAPVGDGNADWFVQSDATHPAPLGVDMFAARIADALTGVA